jgi:tetratricopeptide (TPR) repeat protein
MGLAAARQLNSREGEIDSLLSLVASYDTRAESAQVEAYTQQALTLAYELQDQHRLAQVLHRMSVQKFAKGEAANALEHEEQSLAIFQSLADRRNIAQSLHQLGIIQRNLGHYETAADYLEQAIAIRQRLGDVNGLGTTLFVLGANSHQQGDYPAAQSHFERSLALSRAVGNKTFIAGILNSLGNLADVQGDPASARQYYEQALSIYDEIGSQYGTAMISGNLGFIAAGQGDDAAARRYTEIALQAFRDMNQMIYLMLSLANLTPILIRLEEVEAAIRAVHEAVTLVNRHTGPMQVTVLVSVAQLFTALGRAEEAAMLSGLALHHPTAEQENRDDVEKLRPQLDATLGADAVDAAFEQGKTLDLEATLADLLPKLELLCQNMD